MVANRNNTISLSLDATVVNLAGGRLAKDTGEAIFNSYVLGFELAAKKTGNCRG